MQVISVDLERLEDGARKKPVVGVSPSDFIQEGPEGQSEVNKSEIIPDEQLVAAPSEQDDFGDDRVTIAEPHEAIKDQHNVTVIDSILQKHTSDSQASETADDAFDFGEMDYGNKQDVKEDEEMSSSALGASFMTAATSLEMSAACEEGTTMQAAVSEESVDQTESASLDSEDLEESYGDQQAELAEEMQVHIAPSPQPPQLLRQASDEGKVESNVDEAPNTSSEPVQPAVMPLRTDLKLEIRADGKPLESKPEPSSVGMLKKMESLSSEDIVKTSSSSDTSVEPTLLAATYDLESGAISRVVATYDISPDSVEKIPISASQPKAMLSSPEDEVFEFDTGEVKHRETSDGSTVCETTEAKTHEPQVMGGAHEVSDDHIMCQKTKAELEEIHVPQVMDEATDDSVICQMAEAEPEETHEPQVMDEATDYSMICQMAEAAPEETHELQAIGGAYEIDSREPEAERAPSPFEIVSYEDVSDYGDYQGTISPQSHEHQHVMFEPTVPTAPAVSPDEQSRRPKLSLVEEESPSFEHSSTISSSEPSDFHGPISPFDIQILEQLPDVSAEAEDAAAQPEAAGEQPEEGSQEPDKPEEHAYIYTNGPTEVDYSPEQDMLFQLHAQPHFPPEAAAPVDADSLMLDAEEHSSSETEIQPESEDGEPQEDIASVVLQQQAPEVVQPADDDFPPEEQSFLTESLREDMPAPEFDRMMSSDHTLYDLEMPADEATSQSPQVSSSVPVTENVTQSTEQEPSDPESSHDHSVFETHEESDDYEVPVPTRQTSVSGKAALESEAMAQIFTGPVDIDTPPGYEFSPAADDRETPLLESEHRAMSLEEELAQSQLEETDTSATDSDFMKGINIEETPEPELVALTEEAADATAASHVHFTPVQTDTSIDSTDQQVGDQFELHVDAWDIERPRSPLPDDSCTFWDDKNSDRDQPEDDEEGEPCTESPSNIELSLQETAAEFVDTVLKEAQCALESEQQQLEEAMHDEGTEHEEAQPDTLSTGECEVELPSTVQQSQLGKQMSDDIPEITVTQHLHEEMQEEDELSYTTGRDGDDHAEVMSEEELRVEMISDDVEQQQEGSVLMAFEEDFVPEAAARDEQEMAEVDSEELVDKEDEAEQDRQTDATQAVQSDMDSDVRAEHDSLQSEVAATEAREPTCQTEEDSVEIAGVETQPELKKSDDETPFLEVDSDSKVEDISDDASKDIDNEQNGTNPFLEFSPSPLDEKGSECLAEGDMQKEEEQKGSDPFLVKGLDARMPKEIRESAGGDSSCSSDISDENISDEDGGEEMDVDTELFVNIGYGMSELATIEEERSSIESGTTSSGSHNERLLAETPEETEQQPQMLSREEKLQGTPSPVHSGFSETDSDQTSSADTCTVISSVMPEDLGDSSSVDSFATVVNAEQIETYADDRLKEIASMTSSFTSDMQGSFHEDLVPEPAISIDVRDKPSDICELDDHSPCTEKPDMFEVSRGESLTMKAQSAEKDIFPNREEFKPVRSKALTIKTSAHRELRAYESGKSSSSSSSERLESAAQSPGISGQFFNKSSERDDISISSSLLEFECLEQAVQDRGSLETFPPHALSPPQPASYSSKIGERDNISLSSSLAEFEHLECMIAPSDSPHKKLTPTKEASSLGSVTSLNEFEKLEGAFQSQQHVDKPETFGTASSLSLHSDFDKLEDDELQTEAQKVVSLLESGSLLPPDTSTTSDPFSTAWVISSEKLIEPSDMPKQETEEEQLVPQKEDEDIDHGTLCDTDGSFAPDIDQIIREASDNVQSFADSMQIEGYEQAAVDPSSHVLHDIGAEKDAVDAAESSKDNDDDDLDGRKDNDDDDLDGRKDNDDDDLDGRDDRDYKHKQSTDEKADDTLVPAELHTQDIDADSLQDSETASRSGALDTDSLQDHDSVMAISAESFEFDQPTELSSKTGESNQEMPVGDCSTEVTVDIEMVAVQKTNDPMQASVDSLEDVNSMQRSVDSDSIMQKSVDSEGAMQRSVDSLNVEASQTVQSVSNTDVMTDSLEKSGIPSSVSRDSLEQDTTMTTSVDSLELPLRDRRLADVMLASTESGAWSQTSSGFSSETLKSSGTETEDIMQVSTDCPDFGRPVTVHKSDTQDSLDKDDTYAAECAVDQADTTNTAFVTLDSEGNLPLDSAEQMNVDNEGNMREETETITRPHSTYIEGECFDQYESSTVTLAEASARFSRDTIPTRDAVDSDMTDCYRETRLQPSSSLTSPSTESSHSENCYCGLTLDVTSSQLLLDDIVTTASPRGSRLTLLGVPLLSAWSLPQWSSQRMMTCPWPPCCHSLISSQFHFHCRNVSVVLPFFPLSFCRVFTGVVA